MPLSIYEFGEQLLQTKDLDPVYVILWEAKLDHEHLCQWLIAYWCFYNVGTASVLSESKDFFNDLYAAVPGTKYPRGSERRHFRGEAALKAARSLLELRQTCPKLIEGLGTVDEKPTLSEVVKRVKRWRGFGDWIAFKVADMLERLGLCQVQFAPDDIFNMFDSPKDGAILMAERHGPAQGDVYIWAYNELMNKLGHHKAPPGLNRRINIQEIETILCKSLSNDHGKYPMGKDTKEIREALIRYGRCKTSQQLLKAGKSGGLW